MSATHWHLISPGLCNPEAVVAAPRLPIPRSECGDELVSHRKREDHVYETRTRLNADWLLAHPYPAKLDIQSVPVTTHPVTP